MTTTREHNNCCHSELSSSSMPPTRNKLINRICVATKTLPAGKDFTISQIRIKRGNETQGRTIVAWSKRDITRDQIREKKILHACSAFDWWNIWRETLHLCLFSICDNKCYRYLALRAIKLHRRRIVSGSTFIYLTFRQGQYVRWVRAQWAR